MASNRSVLLICQILSTSVTSQHLPVVVDNSRFLHPAPTVDFCQHDCQIVIVSVVNCAH